MTVAANEKPGRLFWTTISKSIQNLQATDHEKVPLIGYGKSFSSFGEIVQGRLTNDEDFLVTLPIDLWSTCELICNPINGPLIIECDLEKSRSLLYSVLEELGIREGFHIECAFTRNIPIGKGLSSSTADMLAALRATQEVFGLLLKESFISRLFASIEPHDGVHYNSSVAYNHRKGILLANYEYIPRYLIVAVDGGGEVDTVEYNRSITFSSAQKSAFDRLYGDLELAFRKKDDVAIADCATRSAKLLIERTENSLVETALTTYLDLGALGIVATHSGTCAGFLYPSCYDVYEANRLVDAARACFGREPFLVRTLGILS